MEIIELLGANGPFARHIPGFAPRSQQQAMAAAVAKALREEQLLVVEAGTGTGKTYAYLVPALLCGGKVIISTGTRNLQDQLYYKDLPVVRTVLGVAARIAMLKGRANYLCLHRLKLAEQAGRWYNREQAADFARIQAWAGWTRSGDIGEAEAVTEDSPVWPQVTSTVDNCLGQECSYFSDCYLVRARRTAFEADILVINHHLFFADLAIKETGFCELLPGANTFILDEAHQLPEVASHFFGLSLTSRQFAELVKDTLAEQRRDAPEAVVVQEYVQRLEQSNAALRRALGSESRRASWRSVAEQPEVSTASAAVRQSLAELGLVLQELAVRGKGLENCRKRCEELAKRLEWLTQPHEDNAIRWFETRIGGFTLSSTPLEIAPVFREHVKRYQGAWVLTSATLALKGDFSHFAARLGLDDPVTLQLDSPFDFARNALFYHPHQLPEPASPFYTEALIEAALPVLKASRGRAFLLFTSYRALREAAQALENRLDYPLLMQGSMPKRQLLARFQELGNAVLLGTASFWEGVDVRGAALSCVIIDKLPFAAPDDPVLQGRLEAIRGRGGDPFLDYQVPQAVIALKQGIGRLIRDTQDTGVLMLCDPRLFSKSYGKLFLNSLPPMRCTRELHEVRRFFAATDGACSASLAQR